MPQSVLLPTFRDWEKAASAGITGDPLWSVQSYRIALYAAECHTFDRRSKSIPSSSSTVDQLTRAIGSIAANIAEGYSRSTIADRARFYAYALGSTREAIAWYNSLRFELEPVVEERQNTLIQIRRLLLTTLRNAREADPSGMLSDFNRKK